MLLQYVQSWYIYSNKGVKMKRDKTIRVGVTKEELKKITQNAVKKGLTKSSYLRLKGLEGD